MHGVIRKCRDRGIRASGLRGVTGMVLWLGAAMTMANERPTDDVGLVREIAIETTRVRDTVVRRQLTFAESARLTGEDLRQSRRNLLGLNLFKTLEIDHYVDPESGKVDVRIQGEDGWFMMPWPMAGSRGGARYVMLALMEYNFFRYAESVALMGMLQDDEWSGAFAFSLPDYTLTVGSFTRSRREFMYRDGQVSVKDFENATDGEKAADFGTIVNHYDRWQRRDQVMFSFNTDGGARLSLGGRREDVRYEDAMYPEHTQDELGKVLSFSVQYGEMGDAMTGPQMVAVFGRIFGLGMASVEDELRGARATRTRWGSRGSIDYAPPWLGADREFVILGGRLERTTRFHDSGRLEFYTQTAWSTGTPAAQRPATNREYGLRGVYAREFRGDTLLAAGVAYQRPLWTARPGRLTASTFGEYGGVWYNGDHGAKQGVGMGLVYQFWRFPVPLGMRYTYSIDDQNGQYSFAMGGMF